MYLIIQLYIVRTNAIVIRNIFAVVIYNVFYHTVFKLINICLYTLTNGYNLYNSMYNICKVYFINILRRNRIQYIKSL